MSPLGPESNRCAPAAEAEQRVRHRRSRPAGADQQRPIELGVPAPAVKALGEPGPVGVVAHRAAVARDDGRDRAERGRLLGRRVEVLEHSGMIYEPVR